MVLSASLIKNTKNSFQFHPSESYVYVLKMSFIFRRYVRIVC